MLHTMQKTKKRHWLEIWQREIDGQYTAIMSLCQLKMRDIFFETRDYTKKD